MRTSLRAAACLLLLAAPGPAQGSGPAPARVTTTLHQAWLVEVLDLDARRAADLYRDLARDRQSDNPERWIAIARLAELHRLGVTPAFAVEVAEVPQALRRPLAEAQEPIAVANLLARAAGDPAELLLGLGTEAQGMPPLRPAVHEAETWLLGQVDPSWRNRLRLRQGLERTRFSVLLSATRILNAELEGRRAQADDTRALYFTQWRPPAVRGDDAANLARARTRLDALLRDPATGGMTRNQLQRLRDALEKAAATDPAAAMALLLRLPTYAELLLLEQPAGGR
ncbi:MAG: hypothetical protein FJ265_18085 [Planctomycetes bacterium]|nr:hypothetical protein [Planctomycetota bacterium]